MASIRQALLPRHGTPRQQVCLRTRRNASLNSHSHGDYAHNVLPDRLCGERIHEKPGTIQAQRPLHGAQSSFDHDQWRSSGAVR